MKKLFVLFFFLCGSFSYQAACQWCGSVSPGNTWQGNEGLGLFFKKNKKKARGGETVFERSVITIPVVVHVVWNKPEENIPDEQILSQIEVLNRDFRAVNVEIPQIPAYFQSRIADVGFEFCLASRDPAGKATSGITRTFTDNSVGIGGTKAIYHTNQGGIEAWDAEQYLNIWVARFAGSVGGTATFPGQAVPGEEGVQVDYRQFGAMNALPPYDLGRTCTHEIGHYFNLEHIWGADPNGCCDDDDGVEDTPRTCETYLNQCPVFPVYSCSEPDISMNFMFYTNDACLGMFTSGQKERMWNALSQYRPGLLSSKGCEVVSAKDTMAGEEIKLYGNPATGVLKFEIKSEDNTWWQARLFDIFGRSMVRQPVLSNQLQIIDVQHLSAGVYFLEITAPDKSLIEKVAIR